MSLKFRQIAAASCAVVCAVSMCGCSDNGYIGTIDGKQIPTGIYLYNVEFTAYNEASQKITEEKGDSAGTAEVTVFTETIDGKPASAWLKDKALEELKKYIAVENLFGEYGLSLSAEDSEAINSYIASLDEDLGFYAQYYGIEENTFGEHYENLGIGKSSLRSLTENSYKKSYVFRKFYDKDGISPVSEDEINSYASENYAAVKLLKLDLTDQQGISLKDEDEIQAVKDLAQSYADRFNSGADWLDIQYDFDLRNAQLSAWADAEDKYAEEKSSTAEAEEQDAAADEQSAPESDAQDVVSYGAKIVVSTGDAEFDAYVQAAIDEATAERKSGAEDCDQFVNKESSGLDEHLTEYIWNTAADGKASVFFDEEHGNTVYVVVREDITTKESWKSDMNESLLHAIKDDEFDQKLKDISADYTVELNDYLVNTKYAPEKLRGIGK